MKLIKVLICLTSLVSSVIPSFSKKTCNVLSLSGGGAFGVNEVGILQRLYDENKIKDFDIITGISAGGLNAGLLSYYDDFGEGLKSLQNTYINITTKDIYTENIFGLFNFFNTYAFYDTTPLKNMLNQTIQLHKNNNNKSFKKKVLIGSTNLSDEKLHIFDFTKEPSDKQLSILLATSAIPIYFPPVEIDGDLYVDGGLITNELIEEIFNFFKTNQNDCKNYKFTVVMARDISVKNNKIKSVFNFIDAILDIFLNNFDNDLKSVGCTKSLLSLDVCHPTFDMTFYSPLNFDKSSELYNLAYKKYSCYNFC